MNHPLPPSLLLIGVAGLRRHQDDLDVYTATSIRETLATIRLLTFDLMLVGLENPAIDVWELMRRVRSVCPSQRWMLLSAQVTPQEEVAARSLGALLVLNALPHERWLSDFAHSLRRRESRQPLRAPTAPLEAGFPALAARSSA